MSEADSKLRIDFRLMLLVVAYQIKDSSSEDRCSPPDSTLIGTTCFNFHKTKLSWSNAKSACETEEDLLARVESAHHIRNIFLNMFSGDVNIDTFPVWVGARSLDVEDVFVWMDDGARVVEDVWNYREPSSGAGTREDCAAVDPALTLSSFDCALLRPYLCMHDVTKKMTYFKKNVALHCHCSDGNCNQDGDCTTSTKCARRWFGPGCQQRSLPNSLEGTLPVLFDNDDRTCLRTNIFSLNLHFGHNYSFTWIRLVLGKTGQLNDFQLSFPGKSGICINLLKVVVNVRTVDLSCLTMTTAIDTVKVTWPGLKVLCSCYVNGGRNIILMNDNVQTSAPLPIYLSPVDGDKSKNDSCINDTFGYITPHYAVQFHYEFVPREMILNRRINPKGYKHLDGTVIRFYDKSELTIPVLQISASSLFSTVRLKPLLEKPIVVMVVTLSEESVAQRKGEINICELEVFGDCPNGTFGLVCEHKCVERCLTDACFDTGACLHGERTANAIRTTKKLSTMEASEQIIFNTTSTFNPITNSTYQKYPRTTTHVYAKRTSETDDLQSSSTRADKQTKTQRRYTTGSPRNTRKDLIYKLRFSAIFMGMSMMVLCFATGFLYIYHWRASNSKDDSSDDNVNDSEKDSNFTSSKYTSTSNMEMSQSESATVSAYTINTTMSGRSSQI